MISIFTKINLQNNFKKDNEKSTASKIENREFFFNKSPDVILNASPPPCTPIPIV